MFTFGIGAGVNRYLIEGMARVGMGEPFVITKPEETREKAEKYCERFGLRFISIHPMYLDLDKKPDEPKVEP